jgi:hypothetical protein
MIFDAAASLQLCGASMPLKRTAGKSLTRAAKSRSLKALITGGDISTAGSLPRPQRLDA